MKKLIPLLILPVLNLATAHAFIGGISGGHINFQAESTFVHPVYNKSLCFDGEAFHAQIRECAEWQNSGSGDRVCVKEKKVMATQPRVSTALRCKQTGGGDDECVAWERVPLVQNPDRYFDFFDDDRFVKRVEFRVKDCR